jgi:hypothetical protein
MSKARVGGMIIRTFIPRFFLSGGGATFPRNRRLKAGDDTLMIAVQDNGDFHWNGNKFASPAPAAWE